MHDIFELLLSFHKYRKLYEKKCCTMMKKYGLRIADINTLYDISILGNKNLAKYIVDIEKMSKANISKSIDNLKKKNFIILSEDVEDRRCIHISVSELGMPVVNEIQAVREDINSLLLNGVTSSDKETVLRLLKQIDINLDYELKRAN